MKLTKTRLKQIIREEIQSLKEASLNPVVDKLVKSGDKKEIKRELEHFKYVANEKLFDKVVNPKAVQYSINALEKALREGKINEGGMGRLGKDQSDAFKKNKF